MEPVVGAPVQPFQNGLRQDRMKDPSAYGKGRPLPDRTVQMKFVRQQAHGETSPKPAGVPVGRPDVDDPGRASTEPGRKSAFVQGNLPDRLGHENGDDTQHVVRPVQGNPVPEDQVLVSIPAPDADSGKALVHGLDAGQELQGLQHIPFPEKGRHLPHRPGRQVQPPRLRLGEEGLAGVHDLGGVQDDRRHGRSLRSVLPGHGLENHRLPTDRPFDTASAEEAVQIGFQFPAIQRSASVRMFHGKFRVIHERDPVPVLQLPHPFPQGSLSLGRPPGRQKHKSNKCFSNNSFHTLPRRTARRKVPSGKRKNVRLFYFGRKFTNYSYLCTSFKVMSI